MLTACVNTIAFFPPDVGFQAELSLKGLFSRFIMSSALVSLARTQDNVDRQKRDYLALRAHVKAFDAEVTELLPRLDQLLRDDMVRKFAVLLTIDFEAAASLGQWEDLGDCAEGGQLPEYYGIPSMTDSLLRASAPGQDMFLSDLPSNVLTLDLGY